jgi:hypothetical protein
MSKKLFDRLMKIEFVLAGLCAEIATYNATGRWWVAFGAMSAVLCVLGYVWAVVESAKEEIIAAIVANGPKK